MLETPSDPKASRLVRARASLEGLCCGDAFGERFFLPIELARSMIETKSVPAPPWFYTDDTMMAMSIVATLEKHGEIDSDYLAKSFAQNYDPSRGYGPAMHQLLAEIRAGLDWRSRARALFRGEGSFGNGSAMRVAPLGAYFADDLDAIPEQATRSAMTTHCHTEAVAGAIAVALAAGLASVSRVSRRQREPQDFLERVHVKTPDSHVRNGIRKAMEIPAGTAPTTAASALGNGSQITCQDTVPFTLWCAATYLHSYEEALWATVSGLGDRDTTCAIVGGIVVAATGVESIPKEWIEAREAMPTVLPK
jgi:ADP-ribosylglycohydrolase